MNRVLLALMALLAGLVASAGPASARMCVVSDTEVGSAACTRPAPRAVVTQAANSDGGGSRVDHRDGQRTRTVIRPKVYIPTVQFGPDRAFE